MSAVLGWLAVLGIFLLSILLMIGLGYVVSLLFRGAHDRDERRNNSRHKD